MRERRGYHVMDVSKLKKGLELMKLGRKGWRIRERRSRKERRKFFPRLFAHLHGRSDRP
jgi:hypothetical protein